MLLIGLQWIASQFAKVGLLPDFIAKLLRMDNNKKVVNASCDEKGCCGSRRAGRGDSVVTSATSTCTTSDEDDDDNHEEVTVEHVDNLERYEEIFTKSKASTLFVKFTADWCKPCKAIQPAYVSSASKYNKEQYTFITLDIDGDDCDVITGKLKVAMMPTFVCFRNGTEVGRMSGGNSGDKLNEWVTEMCAQK